MLGEMIGEELGKSTNTRVLPSEGGAPKAETSFQSMGKILGVEHNEMGTYTAVARPDGTLGGSGQGLMMTKDGGTVAWTGQGVGKFGANGSTSWRGSLVYQTAHAKLARLNGIIGVFEYEVIADGTTKGKIWEWK